MDALIHHVFSAECKDFWLTMALTVVPGVLGGLTYGVSAYLQAINVENDKWPPCGHLSRNAFFFAQAVSGMGGAIAALLVLLWAHRFPDDLTKAISLLMLAATAFVAGYVANRLLPAIAESLYNKLTQLAEKTDLTDIKLKEAQKAIEDANRQTLEVKDQSRKDMEFATTLATELFRARDYLGKKDFVDVQTQKILGSLSVLADRFPLNRTLNILFSRMWDEAAKDRGKAIQILRDFINAKQQAHQDGDADTAAAYWNIANYKEFEFQKAADPKCRAEALDALSKALQRDWAAYNQKLIHDPDFADLRATEEGKSLMSKVPPSAEQPTST